MPRTLKCLIYGGLFILINYLLIIYLQFTTSSFSGCDSIATSQKAFELSQLIAFVLRTSPVAQLLSNYLLMQILQCDFQLRMMLLRLHH